MPRSPWSVAGEALVTVALLVGPPLVATRLEWPLGEDTTWTWFVQYLRGGTIPEETVIAALVVILWGLWVAHLGVVVLDVIAIMRGLTPRMGLVRVVWVLVVGGTAATTTHTAAVAAPVSTVAEVPIVSEHAEEATGTPEEQVRDQGVIDRARVLAGFGFDSAALTPAMEESLEPTIDMIAELGLAEAPVVVTGHTDPVGDPHYNELLSERRAQAVVDHLSEHLGEDVEFEILGVGSAQAPPEPQAPYGEHRRVEVAYTLQPPTPAPVPPVAAEPEQTSESTSTSTSERVKLDLANASEGDTDFDAVLVGAVTGAVGMGVGYAAGRRRAWAVPLRKDRPVPKKDVPDDPAVVTTSPPEGKLVKEDPAGLARGVIDEDGYVLVCDTVRVAGEGGLGFVAAHAAEALAAVVTDHIASHGSAVLTNSIATALGMRGTAPGVRVVADARRAGVAAEAELLAASRCAAEADENIEQVESPVPLLLIVLAARELEEDHGAATALADSPGAVVCVLGSSAHVQVTVHCDRTDRIRVTSAHDQVERTGALRCRRMEQDEEAHEPPSPDLAPDVPEPLLRREEEETASQPTQPDDEVASPTLRARLRLFAPQPVVTVGSQEVPGLRSVGRTLLAYLALHPRGAGAEEIADVCFAELGTARAASARKNAIASVRSCLRDALEDPEHPVIVNRSGRYMLDEQLFDVDLWNFFADYKKARSLTGSTQEALLEKVVQGHSAKLLESSREVWVESTRSKSVRVVVDSLLRLSDSKDEAEDKIRLLERACQLDEMNEPIYQRVMSVHISCGRPEMAHQVYRSLKEKLASIGEKPTRASRSLIEGHFSPVMNQTK